MLLVLAIACTGAPDDTGETGAPPSYAELQYVFDRNCVGCHDAEEPAAELSLLADASYAALVGVASVQVPTLARVAPGDPEGSYLIHKLRRTHVDVGGTGDGMPPYLVLADTEIALFSVWIAQGAAP